ncbi:MAG TPA: methyltransferase, partial [Pirellulaceae bacterium]|nr:methyltransferase [Pirellulaceae bacterium]
MTTKLLPPQSDPAPIFEIFRGNFAMELLTAAVAHFGVFDTLAAGPIAPDDLRKKIGLGERQFIVLMTGLKALKLVEERGGKLQATPLAREHLTPGGPLDVSDYIRMGADAPGVLSLVQHMQTSKLAGAAKDDDRAVFIFKDGLESAMHADDLARHFTLMLAGRAKNIAPVLAQKVDLSDAKCLLDIGGGTGLYSIAFLQRFPKLKAIILDSPAVLKVAAEFAQRYGVADRLTCQPGDMFKDPLPTRCEVILLSNVLHDWDVPECEQLVAKAAAALPAGGRLLIHDAFLSDDHSGPLYPALFSVALMIMTEGRNYSGAEYAAWMRSAGLTPAQPIPTRVRSSVQVGP